MPICNPVSEYQPCVPSLPSYLALPSSQYRTNMKLLMAKVGLVYHVDSQLQYRTQDTANQIVMNDL
jgi:hypothetical protein